jgi:maltooligosyltrehalose trehalohydrolase
LLVDGISEAGNWHPSLGAIPDAKGVAFRVWAPERTSLEVVLTDAVPSLDLPSGYTFPLTRTASGYFEGRLDGLADGARYRYRLDGNRALPDPASRFQPLGVHGPSEVVDPRRFSWNDEGWTPPGLEELVIYELHVGCFTTEGTFQGVISRLDHLVSLGVNAVQLMPVAEFAGRRNWGYDGVDLFAPSHHYGQPDDLRRLVDEAHARGLAVILDVVYNHLGPDGAYLSAFSSYYFAERHQSPWGDGVNLDGTHREQVRRFFIENALHWLHEYHLDGLRLDATHAIQDDSRHPFLCELSETVRSAAGSGVLLIAEDERNLDTLIREREAGGYGLDAVWSDDFHHQVRRLLAGDSEGYFANFSGTPRDLAETIARGWFFCGQATPSSGESRGTDPRGLPLERFVVCLQNHDQVGNRALGDRLHHQIDLAAYRAASAVLLFVPETPLLFMGQEWAASSPFPYFTDHEPDLGQKVTEGRRAEFAAFSTFADPEARERIPDPQAESTFVRSRLNWEEREHVPHAGVNRLYEALLRLRRADLAPGTSRSATRLALALAPDDATIVLRRGGVDRGEVLLAARFQGEGRLDLTALPGLAGTTWDVILTTEDEEFAGDGRRPRLEGEQAKVVFFPGPSAILLRRRT